MLTVTTYAWHDPNGKHNDKYVYGAEDVRLLQRMVARNLTVPHEFVCITDRPEMFEGDADIRAVPLDMKTHVPGKCYCRLFTFSPQARELLGERVLQMDLDTVIVGNMDAIVDRDEDLVLWHNPRKVPWSRTPSGPPFYNTSMLLLKTGAYPQFYTEFDAERTPKIAKDDQWLLSAVLGPDMPFWDQSHGVYRLAVPGLAGSGIEGDLPENARIVFCPGDGRKPFYPHIQAQYPWIRDHYDAVGRAA